jgi:ribosomal protein S18 acetylase RimI-like enzyme
MINAHDVGHRVVVRRLAGERDGRPVYTDILGELREWGDELLIETADGRSVAVPLAHVALAKRIPPKRAIDVVQHSGAIERAAAGAGALPQSAGTEQRVGVLELERIAALGWRGLRTERLGGWLLRSAGGFTGRANSVLPLGDPGVPLDEAIAFAERWYRDQGLRPMIQVPLPELAGLQRTLLDRGWQDGWGALVQTAGCARLLAAIVPSPDLPAVEFDDEPPPGWLAYYHYRGGELPPNAIEVLRTGGHRRFASVREGGQTLAIMRIALHEGWIGLTAVEVEAAHRRRGLATHLLRAAAAYAIEHGTPDAYLQVEDTNLAARALYGRAGFTTHHSYRYLRAPA